MEKELTEQEAVDQIYNFAANLMVNEKKNASETRAALVEQGLSEDVAGTVVKNLQSQISDAKKKRANKDILWGAIWCVGGIVATAAEIGYIFWGAIVFGGIQLIRGLINSQGD
ncbi:hypothetical protein [Carboxylicivirga sp. RSCT41]|uniref:hypothetical protein n=1 Tax=Carboxylicivirga agarovorans TaxID=3417570 RepID=UPI003D33BFD1